jgi:hypothetical protein
MNGSVIAVWIKGKAFVSTELHADQLNQCALQSVYILLLLHHKMKGMHSVPTITDKHYILSCLPALVPKACTSRYDYTLCFTFAA